MMTTFYLYVIKGWVNRLSFYPGKTVIPIIIILASSVAPFLYMQNRVLDLDRYVVLSIFSAYFLYLAVYVLLNKEKSCGMSDSFYAMVQLVPAGRGKLHTMLLMKKFLQSLLQYSFFYFVMIVPAIWRNGVGDIVGAFIVIALLVAIKSIASEMADMATHLQQYRCIKIALSTFAAITSISLFIAWSMPAFSDLFCWLPGYIFADALQVLIQPATVHEWQSHYRVWFRLVGLFVIVLITFRQLQRNFYVTELNFLGIINHTHFSARISLAGLKKMLFVLPEQISILAAKELLQIWRERRALLGAMIVTVSFLFFSSYFIKSPIIKNFYAGYLFAMNYTVFSIARVSLLRDARIMWLYKACYPRWRTIIINKTIACYLGAIICSFVITLIYSLSIFIADTITLGSMFKLYLMSLILLLPGSVGFGLIIAAILPYQIMEKDQEINYKQDGMEGIAAMVAITIVAIPTCIILLDYPNNFHLKILFFAYECLLLILGVYVSSKRLKSI